MRYRAGSSEIYFWTWMEERRMVEKKYVEKLFRYLSKNEIGGDEEGRWRMNDKCVLDFEIIAKVLRNMKKFYRFILLRGNQNVEIKRKRTKKLLFGSVSSLELFRGMKRNVQEESRNPRRIPYWIDENYQRDQMETMEYFHSKKRCNQSNSEKKKKKEENSIPNFLFFNHIRRI